MTSTRKTLGACCALALAVTVLGPVTGASASKASIRAALGSYSGRLAVAEGHVLSAIGEYKASHNPAPVEEAIAKSVTVLTALKSKIAAQPAAKHKVRQARRKLVAGLQDVISSYNKLKAAFSLKASNPEAAQAEATRALAEVDAGRKKLKEAIKLLR